jgi:hypothetical protein
MGKTNTPLFGGYEVNNDVQSVLDSLNRPADYIPGGYELNDDVQSFLGSLNRPADPNIELDRLRKERAKASKEIFSTASEKRSDDIRFANRIAASPQAYSGAPLDIMKPSNDLGLMKGVLPDKNTLIHTDQQYPESPMDFMRDRQPLLSPTKMGEGALFEGGKALYDYSKSPFLNEIGGKALAMPVVPTKNESQEFNSSIVNAQPEIELPSEMSAASVQAPLTPRPVSKMAEPVTTALEKTPVTQTEDPFMGQLKAAQEARRENLNRLNLIDAADQIGQSIARGGRSDNTRGNFDTLRKHADLSVNDLLKANETKQINDKFKLDSEKAVLDINKAKLEAKDEAAQHDPSSPSSVVARNSVIFSLIEMKRFKEADAVRMGNMTGNQIEKTYGKPNLSNMFTNYETQQNRLEMAKIRGHEKDLAALAKADDRDIKRIDAFNKLSVADLARNNTAFGRNANIVRSSDAIATMVEGKDPDKVTPQQAFEIAKSLDAMLSTGSTSISGTEHLMPGGWGRKYASMKEFVTNSPQGALQGGYVKNALELIRRERKLAQDKINQTYKSIYASGQDLAKKPSTKEAWNTMLQQKGIDPNLFNDNSPSQDAVVKIKGPSGQVVQMKQSVAEKYLKMPGYGLVK